MAALGAAGPRGRRGEYGNAGAGLQFRPGPSRVSDPRRAVLPDRDLSRCLSAEQFEVTPADLGHLERAHPLDPCVVTRRRRAAEGDALTQESAVHLSARDLAGDEIRLHRRVDALIP